MLDFIRPATSNYISRTMKKLYILLFSVFIGTAVFSQTIHNVVVSDFEFDPAELTIDEGDIVIWNNTGGFHNVDGNSMTFPENPEAFGNDLSADLWTYEFNFETAGTYNYQCAQHNFMEGIINVLGANSTDDQSKRLLRAFPVPAEDYITISGLNDFSGQSQLDIFDITGKRAMQTLISANERIDISSLNQGIYFFNVITKNNERFTGKILAQ